MVPMNNVKTFDKHVQRCLTVKNDSVLHSAAMKKGEKEAGYVHPSILSSTNSILSHNLEEVENLEAASRRQRASMSQIHAGAMETSSTPSLSPMPMAMLGPRQETDEEEHRSVSPIGYQERKGRDSASSSSKNNRTGGGPSTAKQSSHKFFFFKGRNYSTLTRYNNTHINSNEHQHDR